MSSQTAPAAARLASRVTGSTVRCSGCASPGTDLPSQLGKVRSGLRRASSMCRALSSTAGSDRLSRNLGTYVGNTAPLARAMNRPVSKRVVDVLGACCTVERARGGGER